MPLSSKSNDTGNVKKLTAAIDSMLLLISVSITEIKWTMKVVQSHFSLRLRFQEMFNDSAIAKKFHFDDD